MNRPLRRLLYLSFILIFLILAPIFIAYSLGYRYRFDTNMLEKNGAFYIKSYPRSADIYLDGQPTKHRTPDQITEVRPGAYLVTIIKSFYVPWQKQLKIIPGETTFVQDVVLFLSDIKKTVLGTGASNYLVNKQKDQYAYIDNKNFELFITDVEQDKNYSVYNFRANYQLVDWSPDNQNLLLGFNNKFYTFNINEKQLTPLNISRADKIIWDSKDSQLLWFITNKKLYTYNLQTDQPDQTTEAVKLDENINDFALIGDYLVIHYTAKDENSIDHLDKNSLEKIQTINNVNFGKIKLLFADKQKVVLTRGASLYIKKIDKEALSIPVNLVDLHDDRLLLSNGHEIILYNYKDDQQTLIDRSTQVVSDLVWHPDGSYFITEINGRTNLTEIDGRDKRNTINILDNPLKKAYIFNKKGDQLFVLTPEENFYLTIQ